MKPILYNPDEVNFLYNGLGPLADATECAATCERNGSYFLTLKYPATGKRAEYLRPGYCIKALANDKDRPQIFRIYGTTRRLDGTIDVKANHISYDLTGRPVKAYSAAGAAAAIAGINANSVTPTGFEFDTDLTSAAQYAIATPRSARAILGGADGSLIDTYGGELVFNNFRVSLLTSAGQDNGVVIRYGKNLTELASDADNSASGNGIYPFWYRENDGLVVPAAPSVIDWGHGYNCYKTVDLTDKFQNKPTAAQLSAMANTMLTALAATEETIEVSFVSLAKSGGYDVIASLETVGLCDTVGVIYTLYGPEGEVKMSVNVKTKVVKTVYDALGERYDSIVLGTLKKTIADYILEG